MSPRLRFVCLLVVLTPALHAEAPRRDRYGDPLPPGAIARLGTTRLRHFSRAFDVAFSPDGKMLASVGEDHRIRLWDAATGKQLRALPGHPDWVRRVVFSPDGKLLVSAGHDSTVRLWNVTTGRQIGEPMRHFSNCLAFAPDGKTLAFSDGAGRIHLWEVAAAKTIRTFGSEAVSAAFAADGRTLAVAVSSKWRGIVQLWDIHTGKELWHSVGHRGAAWSVAFSPDGKSLVSGGGGTYDAQGPTHGEIKFWDPASGKERRTIAGLTEMVAEVCFSPDGKYLASAGGPTILWDWKADGGPRRVWEEADNASGIAFSPDSRRFVWCSRNALRLLDLPPRKERNVSGGHTGTVSFVAFTPDGKSIISVGEKLRVWDAVTFAERRSGAAIFRDLRTAALASDGKTLVTSSDEGILRWDLATMKMLRRYLTPQDRGTALALSPDGKTMAISVLRRVEFVNEKGQGMYTHRGSSDIRLWDVASGEEKSTFAQKVPMTHFAYAPNGNRLAAVSYHEPGNVHILDVKSGVVSLDLKPPTDSWVGQKFICFSPDGKLLASGDVFGRVWLWEADTGKALRPLRGSSDIITTVAFSPDSKMLVAAGYDATPRLWDVAAGKLPHELPGHQAEVLSVAFSPDGKRIATASADANILIWDVAELARPRRPITLSAEECETLWMDLGTTNRHHMSQRALQRLRAAPQSTVAFLKQRFPPEVQRDERLKRLLADLDSDTFAVRENASRKLAGMGKSIEPALRRARGEKLSPEQSRRVQELLDAIAPPPPRSPRREFRELTAEQQRLIRAAVVLDRIGTAEALDLLQSLVYTTQLKAIVNDPQLRGDDMREAKEALKRLTDRPGKP